MAEDALIILPPTRTYSDAEVRKALAERGVDGVLLITVADSGVISQYAGTIFQSTYSGTLTANGTATQMGNTSTVALSVNLRRKMMVAELLLPLIATHGIRNFLHGLSQPEVRT